MPHAQLAALANDVTKPFGDPATLALAAEAIAKRRLPR
uniref:Dehydrogluconate dehydrogenase, cytochrome c subunit n=1 Tax=Ralstonia solanacearum TaxID=305 RepID=A0A0S4TT39_RALSL